MQETTVKVLIQGYAHLKQDGRWDATSTTVLVQSCGKLVLIDPGCTPGVLEAALAENGLRLGDIDIVAASHSHYDHSRNSRLFGKEKLYSNAAFFSLKCTQRDNVYIPDTEIKVVHTPGHMEKHIAFLVKTDSSVVAVAGDVFWWEDGQDQKLDTQSLLEHRDPVCQNEALLRRSRQNLLNIADCIIPGHGKEFTVANQIPGR